MLQLLNLCRLVLPIAVVAQFFSATCKAQNPDRPIVHLAAQEVGVAGAKKLVEGLVNSNPQPAPVGEGRPNPVFDTKYDWAEYDRVWKSLPVLHRSAEAAWPELVSHLNDDRYCITIEANGFARNWTVSDVCRNIISDNLSEAYYQELRQANKSVYARFKRPEIALDKQKLKAWCEARSKKKLYQLQIEASHWAIAELEKDDEIQSVTQLRKKAWIASIEAKIESLNSTHDATASSGYTGDFYVPYSSGRAEKLRQRQADKADPAAAVPSK